jgi:hypothetical protein
MIHFELSHIPFAFSLLPFLGAGICLPAILQDWRRGQLMPGDAVSLVIGLGVVVAWYWAILHSVKSKRGQGKEKLLGRALDSWLWSPPLAFVVGLAGGLSFLFA